MYNIIFNVLYILVVSSITIVIVNNIIIAKLKLKHIIGLLVVMFIPSYLLFTYQGDKFSAPISTIITIIYLYIIFKKIIYAILISVTAQIIFALSDSIIGLIFMLVFRFSYSEMINNKIIYFLVAVSILLLAFIISKIISIIVKRLKYINFSKISGKNLLILLVSLIMILISLYSFSMMFKYMFKHHDKSIAAINFFITSIFATLLIVIIYLNNYNYRQNLEKKYKDEELANLNEYTSMLENKSNDLRKFKHDYANIIKVIEYYIDLGDMDKLKAFYKQELLPESEKIINKDISIIGLENIKINPIKVFISSKINIAEKRNIKVHVEVEDDITEISIGLIDLCRIIGIFFDNAIEAAELCKDKFIEFAVIKDDDNIIFIISNSCDKDVPPVHKIYKNDFSSKGDNRGIGLKSVMDIIHKNYNNIFLNTTIENCVFKQEIIIYELNKKE
ncbi:MAG: hypothetical protein K0R06_1449 [Clostridium sp.]|jgi:two-component system sensor histidine kinase AgrC|nr:hypothetical protein [Clostridium sp.]